jgi:hypothetical protein
VRGFNSILIVACQLTLVACQSSETPKPVVVAKDAGSNKPEVFALGGNAAKTPPSWAPDAIAKITALKDAMCACTDGACAEKVTADMTDWSKTFDVSPEKADAPTQNKILELSIETSKCKTKLGPAPAPTANTPLENQALDLMDKLAAAVAASGKDCTKLVSTIEHFTIDNREMIARTHAQEKTRTALSRRAFAERNQARVAAFNAKMKPTMDACAGNEKLKNATTAMAEVN